nr:hypothetical protein [Chloroflexota bacterium]
CFAKYLAWEKGNPLTPVMIETPLVSELFKYGGTPDLLAGMDDGFVLIDFKTGGRIYEITSVNSPHIESSWKNRTGRWLMPGYCG